MPSSPIRNWPECLMEAAGLALFMLSACAFTTVIEYPTSPLRQAITEPFMRRALMGVAMGLTAVGIIYSPWGQRSGAHLNPSVTLTFWRLGKVQSWDAIFYIVAQFGGALGGVLLAREALGNLISDPSVNYAVTVPGVGGAVGAFLAEALISCCLMGVVLIASNTPRLARLTGFFAGALIAIYIALEAPLSGMSMNPARTFASAVPSGNWTAVWVYFAAPPVGMLLAAEGYLRVKGSEGVKCAKLHHQNAQRCIFRCDYRDAEGRICAAAPGLAGR